MNHYVAWSRYQYIIYESMYQDFGHPNRMGHGQYSDLVLAPRTGFGMSRYPLFHIPLFKAQSTSTAWWRHKMECFPRYWPFVRGIHRSPVNSLHKGQWRGALMFSLICAWIIGWVNNRKAGDLRRHRAHYDVTVMCYIYSTIIFNWQLDLSEIGHG